MATPVISVITPAFQAAQTVEAMVAALGSQDYPKSSFELVLVDDGSTDDTIRLAERAAARHGVVFKLVRRNRTGPTGPGSARNEGMRAADGRIFAFTDADCIPDKDWLSVVERLVLREGHTFVGGVTWCDEVLVFPWRMAPAGHTGIGANIAFDSAAVGPQEFSNDFSGAYGEDTDFKIRLSDAGYQLQLADDMRVQHPARIVGIQAILRRSRWRQDEVLLFKTYGLKAMESMNQIFRPVLFGRVSVALLVVLSFVVATIMTVLEPARLLGGYLAVLASGTLVFLGIGYKQAVYYVPAGKKRRLSVKERCWTLVSVAVYLFAFVVTRVRGSIRHRFLLL